jgi:hypothetical protein
MKSSFNSFVNWFKNHPAWLMFFFSLSFILVLEAIMRPSAIGGVYFQQWTSEDMMQTLPILDLRDHPIESLYYLHIQPPALDFIRAVLAQRWRTLDGLALLRAVDQDLYRIWAILFALMGVLIFRWLSHYISTLWSFIAATLFMIHPASILYATFLESTFLFSLGILWSYYELWKISQNPKERSILPVTAAFILIFLTRSIMQWPAFLIYILSLLLLKVPWRKIAIFSLITGAFVLLYTARQLSLFDIPYTSSLAGGNCFHGLGNFSTYAGYGVDDLEIQPPRSTAGVLNREYKLTGVTNFNQDTHLQYHRALLQKCTQVLLHQPRKETALAFFGNFLIYLQPSSQFTTPHVIADRLPWRALYNTVFSRLVLIFLFLASLFIWIKTNEKSAYLKGIGLLLPAIYIFLMTVLFERGENMRYKFFLEPVFYVFLVVQIRTLVQYFLFKSKNPAWSTTVS